jgi:hypothetical protein
MQGGPMISLRIAALLPLMLLTACATSNSARAPDADLHRLKTFYVVRVPEDGRGVEKIIAKALTDRGYQSSSGDTAAPPARVDAIVTYQDHWMWDMTMYMIKLDLQVHDGASGTVLAKSEVMRPSLQRKSPQGMVDEALDLVFK